MSGKVTFEKMTVTLTPKGTGINWSATMLIKDAILVSEEDEVRKDATEAFSNKRERNEFLAKFNIPTE